VQPGAPLTRAALAAADEQDPLRQLRQRFQLPAGLIYLDGNSLGALPAATPAHLRDVVERQWGQDLIRSWNAHGWVDLPQRVGEKIGQLIGARAGETLVSDSTSVNLFKLLAMALAARPGRRVILTEAGHFPTDLYIAQGLCTLLGERAELRVVAPDALLDALDEDVAVLSLSHVDYRSGRLHDLPGLTRAAHQHGALALWDLAHSAGVVPLQLATDGVDLAVGCGYKYLNGGPGAPSFVYVSGALQHLSSPIAGWFGHARPFAFEPDYVPAEGIGRLLAGTPPILSLAALEPGVDLALEAPAEVVREKSMRLTELFIGLVEQELAGHGLELASPRDAQSRGSQVCLRHPQAWPLMQALIARGVVGDFRAPDLLRFGFAPLYIGYADLWDAVAILRDILQHRSWDTPAFHARQAVT
jgi:kynureninase